MYRWVAVFLCLSILALSGVPGAAAKDEKDARPAAGSAEHGGEAGDHKPSPFEGFLDLTIWTWVVFLLLFFVLRKYAWKPMLEGLQKREETIHQALEEAQKAREEAERLRTEWQEQLSKAHEKAREIVEEAHRDGEYTKAQKLAEAQVEIQKERERALREIHTARDQALQELWNQSAQLATLISAKVLRRQLNLDDHRRLVDEAIAEMRGAAQRHT